MKQSILAAILICLICASCTTRTVNRDDDRPRQSGLFGAQPESDTVDSTGMRVLQRNSVATFRGREMPDLLERLDSNDPTEWDYVRSHVHPAPMPPVSDAGRINYEWPPRDPERLSNRQKAWRSYVLWPEHLRTLLHADDWNESESRRRLARFGRMYRIVHRFQSSSEYRDSHRESEHWRDFAESLLAYGDDGRQLLISNMVLALTNPDESVVRKAQDILVQLGPPAIEPLCTALWTGHNQLVEAQDTSGETVYIVQTNANFPKYIIEVLFNIGPRVVSQAVYELENGPTEGTAWRFRKNFVELLGRFRDPRGVRTLVAEVDRVNVYELDRQAYAQGREVLDQAATDHARFVYREYLLKALGDIGVAEGLRGVIRIWELDRDHELAAMEAVFLITRRRVRSLEQTRIVAEELNIDVRGD